MYKRINLLYSFCGSKIYAFTHKVIKYSFKRPFRFFVLNVVQRGFEKINNYMINEFLSLLITVILLSNGFSLIKNPLSKNKIL